MGRRDPVVTPAAGPLRLIPRWYAACVLTFFGLFTCVGVVAAAVEDGVVALAWGFLAAAGVLFVVSRVIALALAAPAAGADTRVRTARW